MSSSQEMESGEFSEEHEVENRNLAAMQKDTELLHNDLEEKGQLIVELEIEKQLKDTKLSSLQNLLDAKMKEYQAEDSSKKAEVKNETEWNNRLKTARIKRMTSILEYKDKMNELREQVFSPLDLDDAKINEEIEYLLAFHEELTEKNKLLQFEIDEMMKRTSSETEANDIIDSMTALIKQLELETDNDRISNQEMQEGIMILDKKIREIADAN